MAGALELFSMAAKLVLEKTEYDKGVDDADKTGKTLSENLSGYMEKAKKVIAGLFSVVAIKQAAKAVWDLATSTAEAGDRIDKQSQAIGFSRQAYQEWGYILQQNGASIDSLNGAMRAMNNAISGNSAETASALSKLGLSAAQLQSLSPEEQFDAIVKALQQMPEGAEKSQIAMQLLGRGAQSLMPMLNSSSDEIDDLRQRAHDLGLIMSDEDVDASVAFGDALDDLRSVWTALQQKFGAQMLPTFTKGLVAAANALGRITTSVEEAFKTGDWSGVFETITEEIRNLLPGLIDTIVNIATGIVENADKIVDLAVSIVEGLADGLLKAVPKLVQKLPQIFKSIVSGVLNIGKSLGNSFIDVLNNVFRLNLPHLDNIRWPTWDEVKQAATVAWDAIKRGLTAVFKFIFGETEDGGIKWPTWDDVKAAATAAWDAIKAGLSSIFKFIFGETEDGGIKWPTAEEAGQKFAGAVSAMWEGVKTAAKAILKFIFGDGSEDGGIEFPDASTIWPKINAGLTALWDGIKGFARGILKFMFGESEDGGINFPEPSVIWEKISGAFDTFWSGLGSLLSGAAKWVLQLFGLPEETVDEIVSYFNTWWDMVRECLETAASWVLSLFGFVSDDEVAQHFKNWWSGADGSGGVKALINKLCNWTLALFGLPPVDDAVQSVVDWWNGLVADIEAGLDAVFFTLGLPSIADIRKRINDWWQDIIKGIKLSITSTWEGFWGGSSNNFVPEGSKFGGGRSGGGGSLGDNYISFGRYRPGSNAKGLNYVPYDGYRAILHRGETVLNQSQGREWRQNNSGGINDHELYEAVSSAVAEAVASIQINMDSVAVGNAVTKQVSRNIYQDQYSRRYTTR